jgi:hypothetical protein
MPRRPPHLTSLGPLMWRSLSSSYAASGLRDVPTHRMITGTHAQAPPAENAGGRARARAAEPVRLEILSDRAAG